MIKLSFIFLGLYLFFIGCSDKKYFTPQNVLGEIKIDDKLEKPIVMSNRNGASLSNGMVITKDGIFDIKLKEDLLFLNSINNLFLVANIKDNVISILNTEGVELQHFKFDYTPLSATLHNGILAVVLSNNTLMLWDTNTNEELFSLKSSIVYAIDSKLASPVFVNDSVVFPTLDGKIIFVNLNNFKVIRNITLGGGELFNNIIYLSVDNNVVVANKHKLMTIVGNKEFNKDLDVLDVLFVNNKIYVLSLDGEVIEFDLLLQELNKKKFPFANMSGIIVKDDIYTLESQGYLIKINANDFVDSIYKIDISEYKNNFYTKDIIYYDNKIIKFPK